MTRATTARWRRGRRDYVARLAAISFGCGVASIGVSFIGGFDPSKYQVWLGTFWLVVGVLALLDLRFNRSEEKVRAAVPLPALAEGEVLLWSDAAVDRQDSLSRSGGLILTNRRLGFRPRRDQYDKAAEREWPVGNVESVRIESTEPADGEIDSRTLVFELGADGVRRFVVFDAEAALPVITAKLAELGSARA